MFIYDLAGTCVRPLAGTPGWCKADSFIPNVIGPSPFLHWLNTLGLQSGAILSNSNWLS